MSGHAMLALMDDETDEATQAGHCKLSFREISNRLLCSSGITGKPCKTVLVHVLLPIDCPGSSWICFADQCWRMRLATGYRCRYIEEPAAAAVTCKCLGAYRQFLGMATPIKVGLLRQSIASASGPSAAEHCCLGLASLFEPLREPLRSSCSLV